MDCLELAKVIAQANKIFEFFFVELAGEDDFNAATAKVTRFHNRFILLFEEFGEFAVGADFDGILVFHKKNFVIF